MVESAAAFPAARKFSRRSGNGMSIPTHHPLTSQGKAAWKWGIPSLDRLLISVAEPLVKAAHVYAVLWQAESLWHRRVEDVQ